MIFVTTGSSTYFPGFPRLRAWMDNWARDNDEQVVIQFGADPEEPRHAEGFDFATQEEMDQHTRDARVVVAHVGAGTLLRCRDLGCPVIVVPRDPGRGEAIDSHQDELAARLGDNPWIVVARDEATLRRALARSLAAPVAMDPGAGLVAAIAARLDEVAA